MKNKKIVFSGVQPTGNLHLGNYLGALKNFVSLQKDKDMETIYCVVDLHAITVFQNPAQLKNNILEINRFGMLEPTLFSDHIVPDIMLVPLLAYDNNNNRLGYGGGFYDRYLNKYLKSHNNILTIGIAFSFQKHHKIPVFNNDVKLNYVLTEKGIF